MGHKGLSEPHILLASSNHKKLLKNLSGILEPEELQKIENEIIRNCQLLYSLGESHYSFAISLPLTQWRQNISRLYYAAYNFKRSLTLMFDGGFSTDASDHAKIENLPVTINNSELYKARFKNLRDDRNLCDYSHSAVEADLLSTVEESRRLVTSFRNDVREFLGSQGVDL